MGGRFSPSVSSLALVIILPETKRKEEQDEEQGLRSVLCDLG